jgi:outer membrane protein assembly factor BamB
MNRRAVLALALGGVGATGLALGTDHPPLDPEPVSDPSGDAGWPQPRFDARNTGYSPHATPPSRRPTADWTASFAVGGQPVVGSRVVLPTGEGLRAYDVVDGREAWRVDVDFTRNTPVVDGDGTVYYLTHDRFAGYAMDDGHETWRARRQQYANTGAPTVAEGRLYLPYFGVSALDGRGRITWHTWYTNVRANPAVDDGTVYVSGYPRVAALDATTLSLEWPWEDRDEDSPPSTPVDRAVRWQHGPPDGTLPERRARYSPALSDDLAFVPFWSDDSVPAELRALDRTDGTERWVHRTGGRTGDDAPDWRLTPPVVTPESVLVGADDGTISCLGHGGDVTWETPVGGHPRFLVAGGPRAVVGVDGGAEEPSSLVALDLATGDRLWTLDHADELAALVLAEQRLYVVYAERDTDGDVSKMELLAYS